MKSPNLASRHQDIRASFRAGDSANTRLDENMADIMKVRRDFIGDGIAGVVDKRCGNEQWTTASRNVCHDGDQGGALWVSIMV
jgi:hypothetical protein